MRKLEMILASASPRRQELLRQIGLIFRVLPPQEEEATNETLPEKVVVELSANKALDVYQRIASSKKPTEDFIVLGADTVVALDERIMGKPKDEREAARMLFDLQGRIHQVYTGVTLMIRKNGEKSVHSFSEETKVEFYPMNEKQIEKYIKTKEPMDKAGAYGIQGKFAVNVRKIEGDYNNVVGLPIARLYQELLKLGIDLLV
jgi:septum formation protein